MTASAVRTAAREKANDIFIPLDRPTSVTDQIAVQSFIDGAVWGAALVTLTREQIAEVIDANADIHDGIDVYKTADEILALMQPPE